MKFCPHLLNDINFEPDSLSPCCNVHNIKIPAFPYQGGPVDLQAYAAHLASVLTELQGDTDLCRGCPDLIDYNFSGNQMQSTFATISLNMHRYYCNCKCVYCGLWPQRARGHGYDPLPGIQSLHEQGALARDCRVSWGGGESSILPSFEEASKWLTDNGYSQYIHTNALRFSPAMARLLRRGQGGIDISLDSSSPDVYKKVKGVDGFKVVMDTLKRYCQEGRPEYITLKYIIFDLNNEISEIAGFLRIAASMGVTKVEMSLDFREVNNNRVSDKTIKAAAFMETQAKAMGFVFIPFYVDAALRKRIEKAAGEIAQG